MASTADAIRDFIRRRVYAGKYIPDRKNECHLFVHRFDEGAFPVIYSTTGSYAPLGAANFVGRKLADSPAVFLLFFSWASHGSAAVSRSEKAISVYRQRRPHHRFVFLCNSTKEWAAHAAVGLDAILCNHNAFVDEAIFNVRDTEPTYDAVYNAAMVDWKRHELSKLLRKCMQITYPRSDVTPEQTMRRLADLRQLMPSHVFANEIVDNHIVSLRATEVAQLLHQSRCGLCLSASEGAMFASIEYLLSGLPVVSTPSTGGRDEFAGADYWLTVPDTAEAVAAGVTEMIERKIPKQSIRARTLERVYEHRNRLRETVAEATNDAVRLPTDLGDVAYRFATDIVPWPQASDLEKVLGI